MITAIIVIVVVLLLVGVVVAMYNGLIKLRNLVQEAWRQIDVELTRRHDLIGNLVETVKGYAAHEKGVFEEVTRARAAVQTAAAGNDVPAKAAADAAALGLDERRVAAMHLAFRRSCQYEWMFWDAAHRLEGWPV